MDVATRYGLSDRELQVAKLLSEARSTAQIATALRLPPHTVRTYRQRLCAKVGVKRPIELVVKLLTESMQLRDM